MNIAFPPKFKIPDSKEILVLVDGFSKISPNFEPNNVFSFSAWLFLSIPLSKIFKISLLDRSLRFKKCFVVIDNAG